ncbi:MAG TPA: hypothetical protein IAD14_08855 [Candidatus Coprousia avicola]|nr:hypothetical protein [Candidatus Coprousia avicola]
MREDMIYNPHLYQIRPFQLERMLAIAHARKDARAGGVVFYGDSLTEFYPVARCFAALAANGGPGVYNAGIGGATTEELLWYVDEAVIKYRPRAVVLMAGTNDLGRTMQGTAEAAAENLCRLVDVIVGNLPACRVLVWSPLPCREEIDGAAAKPGVVRTNALLREIFARAQEEIVDGRVAFADAYPALLDTAGSPLASLYRPGDGLHINDAGYDRVTAVLEPKLRALLAAAD